MLYRSAMETFRRSFSDLIARPEWALSDGQRVLWITLVLLADRRGRVCGIDDDQLASLAQVDKSRMIADRDALFIAGAISTNIEGDVCVSASARPIIDRLRNEERRVADRDRKRANRRPHSSSEK